jgi:uncharacterized phage protein (TIGR01671 family)
MYPIKFRAFCYKQNHMAYQGTPDLETLQSFMFHYGDAELMQSTNIFDKNGKEIFERDYIKYSNEFGRISIHKVFRVEGGLVINIDSKDVNKKTPFFEACADSQTKQYMQQCEVIGNPYENEYIEK